MSKVENGVATSPVYVVTCYQNVVGVYRLLDDAVQVQKDLISKNRPADVLCKPLI